jgi:hypothetical protein
MQKQRGCTNKRRLHKAKEKAPMIRHSAEPIPQKHIDRKSFRQRRNVENPFCSAYEIIKGFKVPGVLKGRNMLTRRHVTTNR